jgi:Fe-S cluster assembly ATP-binding protein
VRISNLSVSILSKSILRGIDLELAPGSIHAIMGPNGSGKSTLAYALAGHPAYTIDSGVFTIDGIDLTHERPEIRAKSGLFLAFQYPVAIPGVGVNTFLKEALYAKTGELMALPVFNDLLLATMEALQIDPAFAYRDLNDGFSGGEKKRLELLQLLILKPKVAVLDEIDSGLDIDALNIVAHGLARAREQNPELRLLLITHYQRILRYVTPDYVHVLCEGALVDSGDANLAHQLELKGYDGYRQTQS